MTRTKLIPLLPLVCLVLVASTNAAPEVYECSSLILKDDCKPSQQNDSVQRTRSVGPDQTITTKVTLTRQNANPNRCQANVSISYLQMYDKIRVDATVVNDDCVASTGAYKLRARTRSPDGELETREFIENWNRSATETATAISDGIAPIEQRHTYEMSGDASLVWVTVGTSAKTACSCTDGSTLNPQD